MTCRRRWVVREFQIPPEVHSARIGPSPGRERTRDMTVTRMRCAIVIITVVAAGLSVFCGSAFAEAWNSLFDPHAFRSLGSLNPTGPTNLTFNTDTLQITGATNGLTSRVGTNRYSESGNVRMAVFRFDSINLASNVSVVVTGNQAIVLLSRHSITINTALSVDGRNGADDPGRQIVTAGGLGGAGAIGGLSESAMGAGNGTIIADPPSGTAMHGPGQGGTSYDGIGGSGYSGYCAPVGTGFGASGATSNQFWGGGSGGAGYGNLGGTGSGPDGWGRAGEPYGDAPLTELYGGSGGGAGGGQSSDGPTGGGGGGAIELVAGASIIIGSSGNITAKGGKGGDRTGNGAGGGSGGAILLAACTVIIDGTLNASGGNGGVSGGAGGSGGRIAIYSETGFGDPGKNQTETSIAGANVSGGASGNGSATAGGTGTLYDGRRPPFLKSGLVITVL